MEINFIRSEQWVGERQQIIGLTMPMVRQRSANWAFKMKFFLFISIIGLNLICIIMNNWIYC